MSYASRSVPRPKRTPAYVIGGCWPHAAALLVVLLAFPLGPACGEEAFTVRPDKANTLTFQCQEVKFVRLVIFATNSSGEPCLDELEVYGKDAERNLALASDGARATASSCLPGHAIHQIEHLNDGEYGNSCSWIAAGTGEEWAQIELPEASEVCKVVFSRDRNKQYGDRTPVSFEVRLSVDEKGWKTVKKVMGKAGNVRGPDGVPNPPPPPAIAEYKPHEDQLRHAFLGEEHAWLKTYGRADISPALVPYNGRVKEYPRHVGDDRLPLPPLASAPVIDGCRDDACWQEASQGVARVAFPYDIEMAPLIEHRLNAGWRGDDLFLYLRTDRLLSRHVAVISGADWDGCGVVVCAEDGLVFNTYTKGKVDESTPIDGAHDPALECFEMRLPLALFPGCRDEGLRVGLGMGGKHTSKLGRPVNYVFSSLALAEEPPCVSPTFRVRLGVAPGADPVTVHGNAPRLEEELTLSPGQSMVLSIPAKRGPIGPEYDLTIKQSGGEQYTLHLFRYDPLERTLCLMEELAGRLDAKGIDTRAEQGELERLRKLQEKLVSTKQRDRTAERKAFFEARTAKRRLFLREPDLEPMARILFVKRRPFRPSHNYSTCFDAPFRPGGGIYVLEIPWRDGRFDPSQARLEELFNSGEGIARNPMADFDSSTVYFGYRPSKDGYYHIMSMKADGSDLRQVTDGPFHDYWPCPLPDGGIAFITTRCISRALCWRPQAAILFRMEPDGSNIRALSMANLTEWAPSVMNDGRIIWTRWEYLDKGADFGHTLWSIRPDGAHPELVFGNDIIQPNGYANGREVPGTNEVCCTLISHFGDLNGPIALLDIDNGRFNPKAIASITPEVPWPGAPPFEECFRDPVPLARDYFLCSHAPRDRFGLFVIDRFGNRELVYADPDISSMCPTLFRAVEPPPILASSLKADEPQGEFILADVYKGLETVERGAVKYIRVVEEVRHNIDRMPNGEYRKDHPAFMQWYAAPVDLVNGPHGWPTYVAKAPLGIAPVEEDGSARFYAPAGKVLYFQALDKDFNELQRMRSVVQLQPGEKRSCIGCHEDRRLAPPNNARLMARDPRQLDTPSWGGVPFSFSRVVQPVLNDKCLECHNEDHKMKLDFSATLDAHRIPASYRTLITRGLVHYVDCGWNSGGFEKLEPLTYGVVKSKLWDVLNAGHHNVTLTTDEMRRIKTWIDMNCPLWPDYQDRNTRPAALEEIVACAERHEVGRATP